jgi:HD-like signal output (HDOD) protein
MPKPVSAASPTDSNQARSLVQSSLEKLPPFSPILRRLLANISVDDDRLSLATVGNLIEHDALTAGKVLGIANSALYSRGTKIASVAQAVSRLGANRLRNVILALSVNRIWGSIQAPDNFSISRFNQHALAAATAADLLCQKLCPEFTESAFVAGLFHDIGELLLVNLFPGEYSTLLEHVALEGEELELCEMALFGTTHAEVSAEACTYWQLPDEVQTAVRYHVQPEKGPALPLSRVVNGADRYANAYGYSLMDWPYPDEALHRTLGDLGIGDEEIMSDFVQQLTVLRAVA